MKIGIFSDTHDNLPKIERAVNFFNDEKVDFVLHAGDFIAPFSVLKLKSLKSPWAGVFGNNDGEKEGLSRISEGKIQAPPVRMKLGNKNVVLLHDLNIIDIDKEKADLIIFGHTHKPEILQKSNKLLVNPGECGGWLTNHSTLAVVDLDGLSARIFDI